MKLEFSRQVFGKYSNFMKICPVGAELFHADRRIDTTKLTVAFRNFANVPKNRRKPMVPEYFEYLKIPDQDKHDYLHFLTPRILSVLTQTVKRNILKTGGPSPSSLEIWLVRCHHRNMSLFYILATPQELLGSHLFFRSVCPIARQQLTLMDYR